MTACKAHKRNFWIIWLIAGACCALSAGALNKKLSAARGEIAANYAVLNQALAGFSGEKVAALKDEVGGIKKDVAGMSLVFYPKDRFLKKDYDPGILFIEELNNAGVALNLKAGEKKTAPVAIDFSSKLPSAQEAAQLLSQLAGLRGIVEAGLDLGAQWKTIKPLPVARVDGFEHLFLAPASLELTQPQQTLMEFIARIHESEYIMCLDYLVIKAQAAAAPAVMPGGALSGGGFAITMNVSALIADYSWPDIAPQTEAAQMEILKDRRKAVAAARSANPFYMAPKKDISAGAVSDPGAAIQKQVETQRFFYRGQGVLEGSPAAVIEDVLMKETVFLHRDAKYRGFTLKDFSEEQSVLINSDDGGATVLTRGEN